MVLKYQRPSRIHINATSTLKTKNCTGRHRRATAGFGGEILHGFNGMIQVDAYGGLRPAIWFRSNRARSGIVAGKALFACPDWRPVKELETRFPAAENDSGCGILTHWNRAFQRDRAFSALFMSERHFHLPDSISLEATSRTRSRI